MTNVTIKEWLSRSSSRTSKKVTYIGSLLITPKVSSTCGVVINDA